MPKFRKKPVVIEAYEFRNLACQPDERPEWIMAAVQAGTVKFQGNHNAPPILLIQTLEGQMRADIGDWIIQGVKGEIYPCKPDIFAQTYEPADTPEAIVDAVTDAVLRGQGAFKISHIEPFSMEDFPPGALMGFDLGAGDTGVEVRGKVLGDGKLQIESIEEITSTPLDPATPTCDFCGARVHAPCADSRDVLRCELPPGTVYVDDRRKNMIGGPGMEVPLDDPRHPINRDTRFRDELQEVINRHSRENGSDTPDFILATFLFTCLTGFDIAVSRRSQWYDYPGRIAALEARLEAEGEHTAAGNAEIERLNNEIERITRRQQGVLAEATHKLHKAQNPTGWGK